jgi:hypothetical protein
MNKYGAKKTNGYDSKAEAKRGFELEMAMRAKVIKDLKKQVRFELIPAQEGERPVHYIADFTYRDLDGTLIAEDVKGVRTQVFIIKRKLMLQVHGIKVREVAP